MWKMEAVMTVVVWNPSSLLSTLTQAPHLKKIETSRAMEHSHDQTSAGWPEESVP